MTFLKLDDMKTISGAGDNGGTTVTIYNSANASASANNSGSKSKKGS